MVRLGPRLRLLHTGRTLHRYHAWDLSLVCMHDADIVEVCLGSIRMNSHICHDVKAIGKICAFRFLNAMLCAYMERGSSVVECRTRNQVSPGSNAPLLPFRILCIFVLSIDAP